MPDISKYSRESKQVDLSAESPEEKVALSEAKVAQNDRQDIPRKQTRLMPTLSVIDEVSL